MQFLILGFVVLAAVYFLLNRFAYADAAKISSYGKNLLIVLVLGLVVFLVARGGLQFLWLGILALLPWINRLRVLSGVYRTYKQFRGRNSGTNGSANFGDGYENSSSSDNQNRAKSNASSNMTRFQALEILELEEGATHQDIKAAHHRLMLKHHPDQGGNVEMASLINRAKDVLLEH